MRERLWLTTRRSAQFGGGRKNEVAADCAIQVCRYFEDIFTVAACEVHTVSGLVAVQGFFFFFFALTVQAPSSQKILQRMEVISENGIARRTIVCAAPTKAKGRNKRRKIYNKFSLTCNG